jgi:hypothetical protein
MIDAGVDSTHAPVEVDVTIVRRAMAISFRWR